MGADPTPDDDSSLLADRGPSPRRLTTAAPPERGVASVDGRGAPCHRLGAVRAQGGGRADRNLGFAAFTGACATTPAVGHVSDPSFRTLHALRIKGFAKTDVVADVAGLPEEVAGDHLQGFLASEWVAYREQRALWQLTATGREAHCSALAADLAAAALGSTPIPRYEAFLELNITFKTLCGEWQLREGQPNDHSDMAYDRRVIDGLLALDHETQPIVATMAACLLRLEPYAPRLTRARERLIVGQVNMFTGVMCGSYHDVWMELHEDLILTQGIDRTAEGSF